MDNPSDRVDPPGVEIKTNLNKKNTYIVLGSVAAFVVIFLVVFMSVWFTRDTDNKDDFYTVNERTRMCLDDDAVIKDCCEYCQNPGSDKCDYLPMCQQLEVTCAKRNQGYNLNENFEQCFGVGCSEGIDQCRDSAKRFNYCEDPENGNVCRDWCMELPSIEYSNQPTCQEEATCQKYRSSTFFELCPRPDYVGQCANNINTCNAKDFNTSCISNRTNLVIQEECASSCDNREPPGDSTDIRCDVADTCTILDPYANKYAVCDVNPCSADINTCNAEDRKKFCEYGSPDCYIYCSTIELFEDSINCENKEMCLALDPIYIERFAYCNIPCQESLYSNCNEVERFGYCNQAMAPTECYTYCRDIEPDEICPNQLLCNLLTISTDSENKCQQCDIETFSSCQPNDIDVLCFNVGALIEECTNVCLGWQDMTNIPVYCTQYHKEYNTCYTEGLNSITCDREMMEA